MRNLLYLVAVMSALIGAVTGYLNHSIQLISSGLLAAVLFGIMGKVCHLLEAIEDHMRVLREMRFRGWPSDRMAKQTGGLYIANTKDRRIGVADRRAQ